MIIDLLKEKKDELLHVNSYDNDKKNINPSLFLHKWKFNELIEYKDRICIYSQAKLKILTKLLNLRQIYS